MEHHEAKVRVLSGSALLMVAVGALFLALSLFSPARPAFADGNDSPPECLTTTTTVESSSFTAPAGNVITGVCIKSGEGAFGSSQHSGLITADITVSCYTVSGIGTATVTVTLAPGCQEVSHIDVNYAPAATSIPTSTATAVATNTPTATTTGTAPPTSTATATSTGEAATSTATSVPATSTSTPVEQAAAVVTATETPVVSGIQGGAAQQVAGVQQQVAGVSSLPSAGTDGDEHGNGLLVPLGLGMIALGGMLFAVSRRLA